MIIYFHFKKDFMYCLFMIIFHLSTKIIENSKLILKNNYKVIKILSQISVIFVFIIEKKYTKNFITNTKSPNYQNFKKYLFPKYKIIPLIIFSIIFDFLANYSEIHNTMRFFAYYGNVLIAILIELILFKKEIFSHHYISIFIYFIIIIFFLYTFYIHLVSLILFLINFILNGYCFYFSLFLIKYLNTNYFCSVYLLGSFIGIERLLFQIFIKKQSLLISFTFSKNNLLLINILYLILRFLYYYIYYIIILKLEPIYLYVNECILLLISQVIIKAYYVHKISNIGLIISTIITIISCFIFTEVLELNFCGLNKNIKNNIIIRSENNYISMINEKANDD